MNPYKRGLEEFPPSVETCNDTPWTCWIKENTMERAPRPEKAEKETIVQDAAGLTDTSSRMPAVSTPL